MQNLRQAELKDIQRIAEIEKNCFPKEEAATLASFQARYAVFPEYFLILEIDEKIIGYINGCVYDRPELPDKLYADASFHCPQGQYQTVFGLAVEPVFQKKGYASLLMKQFIEISKTKQHKGIVLTCKDHLVNFYQHFGFNHLGQSISQHGGANWNDMLLMY